MMQRPASILPRAKGHTLWSTASYCPDVLSTFGGIGTNRKARIIS
jgi:hypothetical protein